jgi:peptidyl-prolyl cis-trans isomerase-like 3
VRRAQHSARGILSMANSGPNTNASQFFITYAKHAHLNGKYTVFGRVIGGLEVLDAMEKVRAEPACFGLLRRLTGWGRRRRATPTTRR